MVNRLTMPRHRHGGKRLVLGNRNMTAAILKGLCDKFADVRNGMRAEDHVHVIDVREEPLAISLGDASAHSDDPRAGRWSRKALA